MESGLLCGSEEANYEGLSINGLIMPTVNRVDLKPVFDKEDQVQIYDIYIDGQWCGSRRTVEQANLAAERILVESKK